MAKCSARLRLRYRMPAESKHQINTFQMSVRISLLVLAASLLAAHFFRAGNFLLVALCLATPLLFLYKRRWSLILLQFAAYCATASWLGTTLQLVQFRQQMGRPWTAAVIILVTVALLTLAAGLLMNSRCMRERYPF
ncbi:hypothetical protein [Rhodoferax sp. UBA5149]|uniref:hypothetical protein n=1 Tax=Rhodoferax sp. UBA5149 TaxID=1947379 RepID=UPI0025D6A98A|nr:hypothetical protein [Rhodoferax sp. UBA5149]